MEIHKCANKIYTTDDDDNQQPTTDNDNDNNDEGGWGRMGTNGTDGKVDTIDRTAEGGMWVYVVFRRPTDQPREDGNGCMLLCKKIHPGPPLSLSL